MVSNSRYKIKRNFVAFAAVVAARNTAGEDHDNVGLGYLPSNMADFRKKRHFSSMSHDRDVMRRTSISSSCVG